MNFYSEIQSSRNEKVKTALCIIVQTSGSTPRKIGSKMIVDEHDNIKGTIGGGNLEKKVIEQAIEQIKINKPETFKYNLVKELEMCCGGSVAVYIEPIMKVKNLYIFGAGHTGEALARLSVNLDFEVTLFDDRDDYISTIDIPNVKTRLINFDNDISNLDINKNTFVVIMTYSHPADRKILSYFVDKDLAYLGMIGSQRKVEVAKKMLKDEQFGTVKQINKIDMPIGIDINAEEPEEIAVSILAKLIAVKNS